LTFFFNDICIVTNRARGTVAMNDINNNTVMTGNDDDDDGEKIYDSMQKKTIYVGLQNMT